MIKLEVILQSNELYARWPTLKDKNNMFFNNQSHEIEYE